MRVFILLIVSLLVQSIFNAEITNAQILISTGGTVSVNDGDLFYDAGGAAGNDGNTNYTITLTPAVAGERICLDFTSFNTYYSTWDEKGDSVCIFDGSNTSATKIATLMGNYGADWNGNNQVGWNTSGSMPAVLSPGIFCSTNSAGSLTITFNNYSSTQNSGWVATVRTYQPLGTPGCNIDLSASQTSICNGDNVTLTVTGDIVAAAINNNFNASTVGTGWQGTSSSTFQTNACSSPSPDASVYLWMANSACPRTLTSNGMDVSNGGTVSFEYRQASINSNASPCESPDINMSGSTPEAVLLQYSTNGGGAWNTMKVMFPYNMNNINASADYYPGTGWEVTQWRKIIVPIPAPASTTNTMFRWYMPLCTSASTDNWGLDNVVIGTPLPYTITLTDITNSIVLGTSNTSPYTFNVSPSATTTYEALISDGTNSCSEQITVTVNNCGCTPPSINTQPINDAVCIGENASFNVSASNASGYQWQVNTGSGWTNLSNGGFYSGTNTNTLTITSPSLIMNGYQYQCVISESTGVCPVNSNTSLLTVNSLPTANAGSDASITCTTNASGVAIGAAAVAGNTYTWSPATGLSASNVANPTANPASTSTYNLTVTNSANGCTATDAVTITVNTTPPTANAGSNASITCTTNTSGAAIGSASVAGNSYAWSPATGLSASNVANPTASPASTTLYTVTVTNTANGCTATDAVNVTVNTTPPTANAGSDASITCTTNASGVAIGAAAVAGNTYTWSPATGLSASNVANPTASPASTTLYTVTVTNTANGCTATDAVNVTVNTTPPTANAGSDASITCTTNASGVAIGAVAVAGNTYTWSPATGLSASNVANPTANPASTTLYTVTVTNTANGCTATDAVNVTVNTTPPTANAGPDASITCTTNASGVAIGAAAVAGNTYTWSPATGLSASNVANPTASPASTTLYTVTVTNTANGCTTTDAVNVTVNTTPPTANAGTDASITCSTNSSGAAIGSASVAGNSYTWSPATGLSASNVANPTASPASTTLYTVTVTNTANGCTATDAVNVTVNTTPPTANAGSDASITCTTNASGVAIGAAAVAGNTYTWSPATGLSASNVANPTANPVSTSTYNLTVTNSANGCTATDAVTITVNTTPPTANAGSDASITCTANASGVAIGAAAVAGITYTWSPATGLSASNVANPTASPASTTLYTVTVTNTANGCTATDAVNVTVNTTPPTANAGSDASITCTANASGVAIGAAAVAGNTYTWSPATGLSAANVANPTANPASTSTYNLTVTNSANGCTATDAVTITVNTTPPTANAGSDASITCTANASGVAIGAAAVAGNTYTWSPATGLSASNVANPTANPASTSTYNLTVTNSANGCTATDAVTITVNTTPPTANAGSDATLSCTQTSLQLDGTSSSSGANYIYSWSTTDGNLISGTGSLNPSIDQAGTYTLIVTNNSNGCTDNDQVTISNDSSLPIASAGTDWLLTCSVTSVNFDGSASSSGINYSYSWGTLDGHIVSGQNTLSPVADAPGTYTLTVTDLSNGCHSTDNLVVSEDINQPTASAGIDKWLTCAAVSVNLDGSSSSIGVPYQYHWQAITGNIVSGSTTLSPTVNMQGSYFISVTNTVNGCVAYDTVVVNLNNTNPNADAGQDQTLNCSITSIQLDGSNSSTAVEMTYTWSTSNGHIVSGGNTLTPVVDTEGIYNLEVFDNSNGCSDTDQLIVALDALAPISNAGTDNTLTCTHTSLNLNGSLSSAGNTYSYLWSTTDGHIVSGSMGLSPLIDQEGSYTLEVIDLNNGCSSTDIVVINSNTTPPMAIAGSDANITCNNNTSGVVIGAASVAGNTYAWSPSTGLSAGNLSNPTANPINNTSYTLTVTNTINGCTASDIVTITVDTQLPNANAGNDANVCSNESIQIGSNSISNHSYLWSTNGLLSSYSTAQALFQMVNNTNNIITEQLVLQVTNEQNGCSQYDTLLIQIQPEVTPSITIAADQNSVCANTNIQFTSSVNNEGTAPIYEWFINGQSTYNYGSMFSWSSFSDGDIVSCQLTSNAQCVVPSTVQSNTLEIDILDNAPVSISISAVPSGTICEGTSVTFHATPTNGGLNPIYKWFINQIEVGTGSSLTSNQLTQNDVVSCTLWSSIACVSNNPATDQIQISTYPNVSLSLQLEDSEICKGEAAKLLSYISGGNGGPYTLTLQNVGIINPNHTFYPTQSSELYVQVTDGCSSAQANIHIEVIDAPIVSFTSQIRRGCEPLEVQLISTSNQSNISYNWNFGDEGGMSFETNPSYIYRNSGTYDIELEVKNTNGCTSIYQVANYIEVFPLPTAQFFTQVNNISILNSEVSFINTSEGSEYYIWDFGDGSLSSTESPTYRYDQIIPYTVQLTAISNKGCKDSTVQYISISEVVTFYAPNVFTPGQDYNNDLFVVKGLGIRDKGFQMFIFDRWGEMIYSTTDINIGWDGTVKGGEIGSNGVYKWLVKYVDVNGVPHEEAGTVSLIR